MRRSTAVLILSVLAALALFSGTALAAKLSKFETKHFVFYYEPRGVTANIGARAEEIEQYYDRLSNLLGSKPGRKITLKWYPTLEEFQKAEASKYGALFDTYQKEVRAGGEPSMLIYGITFLVVGSLGDPPRFVNDGLATALFQEHAGTAWFWGEPLVNLVKDQADDWVELTSLAANMDYYSENQVARAESGLTIRYLVDTYGVEQFRKFIKNSRPENDLSQRAKAIYKKTLPELQVDLKAWLASQPRVASDPALTPLPETPAATFSRQRFVFSDEAFTLENLRVASDALERTQSELKGDLGLVLPDKLDWRVMNVETLQSLGWDGKGAVDANGVVRAPGLYDPLLASLAVTRRAGPAPDFLRWGVAVVWGQPEAKDKSWDGRTLRNWGKLLAENELVIPVSQLLTDFPGGAPDRAKAEAGLFVQYLVDRYGKEKFAAFYRAASSADAFGPALETLAGKSVAEVEQEFLASLTK
ncbi:MAG: hypothetical protein ACM3UP_02640 [Methanocella sp.]